MILYNPATGDVQTSKVNYRPQTCFVMTQMGNSIPPIFSEIRGKLRKGLTSRNIAEIDAESLVTGRDFLLKIWGIILSVPLGIAIIDKGMSRETFSNIFYEIGLLQAYGKETLVIKTRNTKVPSDFVRTEYLEYGTSFEDKLSKFLDRFLELPDYFDTMAQELENNPLLSVDYLRRAYLITGDGAYRDKAIASFEASSIKGRAKNSVEMLLVNF